VKQLENPSAFPANIAWLREFYIRRPDTGSVTSLWRTPISNGEIGLAITRAEHYESTQESFVWVAPNDIPAGARIGYRGRAATSTISGFRMKVWPKGLFTVEVDDTALDLQELRQSLDELRQRVLVLEARER
jgi:hypothetical protein